MMIIPVILLNYNSSSDCRKCISFLKRQKGIGVEIVVVDNCSTKNDLVKLKALCEEEECTLIENHENRGYNAGNNMGLRYAVEKGYKYALIANPDMEFPQQDYLLKLIEVMEKDEEIVVCGSDIVSPEGIHQNPMIRDGNWHESLRWITGVFRKKRIDTYDFIDHYEENHYCAKVSGCCLLVKLAFVKEIGFFDEKVFLYCEEAILSRQVENRRKKMYYTVAVQAVHRHIKSEKGNPVKRFRNWEQSRIYFIERYSGDTTMGKFTAKLSTRMYATLFIVLYRLKNSLLMR